jgi:hypothetical protein
LIPLDLLRQLLSKEIVEGNNKVPMWVSNGKNTSFILHSILYRQKEFYIGPSVLKQDLKYLAVGISITSLLHHTFIGLHEAFAAPAVRSYLTSTSSPPSMTMIPPSPSLSP